MLLTRVLYVKPGAERPCVVLDAGMNNLLRPALYDAWHEVLPVAEPAAGTPLEAVDLVGPICESTDVFARGRDLPPLASEDLIVLTGVGAYGAAMASDYNSRPMAAEVLGRRGALGGDQAAYRAGDAQFADESLATMVGVARSGARCGGVAEESGHARMPIRGRSFGFRRRVVLARAAAAFEAAWAALWPSLALIGLFLGRQPARALGVAAGLAARAGPGPAGGRSGLEPVAGARQSGLARSRQRSASPGASQLRSRTSRCARSAIACPAGGDDPATRSLWQRHQERLAQALRRLRVGAPRSDLPRRDPWALRAAVLLLLIVGLVEAGGHGAQAPAPGLRAAPRRAHGRGAGRADALGDAAALHRQAAGPARGRAPGAGAPVVVRAPAKVALPVGSEALASCTIWASRRRASRSAWTR